MKGARIQLRFSYVEDYDNDASQALGRCVRWEVVSDDGDDLDVVVHEKGYAESMQEAFEASSSRFMVYLEASR